MVCGQHSSSCVVRLLFLCFVCVFVGSQLTPAPKEGQIVIGESICRDSSHHPTVMPLIPIREGVVKENIIGGQVDVHEHHGALHSEPL